MWTQWYRLASRRQRPVESNSECQPLEPRARENTSARAARGVPTTVMRAGLRRGRREAQTGSASRRGPVRPQRREQLGSGPRDVARTERQHDITGSYRGGQYPGEIPSVSTPRYGPPGVGSGLGDELGGDSGQRLLARGVDLGQEHDVPTRQGAPEITGEIPRAGVEVRLKRDDNASAWKRRAGGIERRADLRWVVRIIIDHRDPARLSEALEPALNTVECREPWSHRAERHAFGDAARDRGERVAHVMNTWNVELHAAEAVTVIRNRERRSSGRERYVERSETCVSGCHAVAQNLGGIRRRERVRARVVGTQNDPASGAHERRERRANVVEIAIDIEMVGFDVRHDGDRRRQREEGTVVFIRLDDEQIETAEFQVSTPLGDTPADDSTRRLARSRERLGGHHGRGGLPVGSGDADDGATRDRLRECFRTADHGQSCRARGHDFREVRPDRGGHDYRAHPMNVGGIVAGRRRVATGDMRAPTGEQ